MEKNLIFRREEGAVSSAFEDCKSSRWCASEDAFHRGHAAARNANEYGTNNLGYVKHCDENVDQLHCDFTLRG